jgi:hypothetical protein
MCLACHLLYSRHKFFSPYHLIEILKFNGFNLIKSYKMESEKISRNELVSSFSRHAKLTNLYMFGILLFAIIYAMNMNTTKDLDLPKIGVVNAEYFQIISMFIISSLLILFSSSHLMSLRIREYYNSNYFNSNDKDYFDLSVEPTIFRMAPIAWMIKNINVFFINRSDVDRKWRNIEILVYFILKFMVFLIAYIFPVIILLINVKNVGVLNFSLRMNFFLRIPLIGLFLTSSISFAIVLKNEIIFTFRMPDNNK